MKKFYQVVNIPHFNEGGDTSHIDYDAISTDATTKTTSILEAIAHISLSVFNLADQDPDQKIDKQQIESLSCIIVDLAELGIATNKIAESATFSSGREYQIEYGDKKP
jgi:hypothetical protein